MAQVCNPSYLEQESEGWKVQSQPEEFSKPVSKLKKIQEEPVTPHSVVTYLPTKYKVQGYHSKKRKRTSWHTPMTDAFDIMPKVTTHRMDQQCPE